jgi:hypothetical protein
MGNRPTLLRRILRFRLRTLLLLPIIFAVGWWWVTWPERTARRFVDLLAAGNIKAAQAMSDFSEEGLWILAEIDRVQFKSPELHPGNWREYIASRRTFRIPLSTGSVVEGYAARRNRIRLDPGDGQTLVRVYAVKYVDARSIELLLAKLYEHTQRIQFQADLRANVAIVQAPLNVHSIASAVIVQLDVPSETVSKLPLRNLIHEAPFNQNQYLKEIKRQIPGGRDLLLPH